MKRLIQLFEVPDGNPELTAAQLRALAKQIPLLYVILIANTIFVSATHFEVAPAFLSVCVPAVLVVICLFRMHGWKKIVGRQVSHAEALKRLRDTVRLVLLVGIGFTAWGLALSGYGDAYQRMHVVFYMSITTIACVFCLMNLRNAALGLTLTVLVPATAFFATRGEPVLAAIAANFLLVAVTMVIVVFDHYRDFSLLIAKQQELREKQMETQRLSDENMRMALLDSLTGLPNRRSFFSSVQALLRHAADEPRQDFAIGLIDLDGFKSVNDLYGHAAGDQLLIDASLRMRAYCGAGVELARLGGDEFGVILNRACSEADLVAFGQGLCEQLRLPYVMAHITVDISASAGFVLPGEGGTTAARLLENADYALYQAKQRASGGAVIFNGEHANSIKFLNQVDHALRNADFEQELSLVYQGLHHAESGELMAVEALARWNSPVLGWVAPVHFIKAAERSDLINRLTVTLFRQALRDLALWPERITLSFNLSARDIASPETMLKLVGLVMKSGVDPRRVIFEVTETAVMADFDLAVKSLSMLRSTGARVALDDFGSGYSSLGYVHRLPLDEIKIDGAFAANIIADEKARNILKTIVSLAHNIGIPCVAEAIESEEQRQIVAYTGCDLAQGYLFSKPVSHAQLVQSFGAERPDAARARTDAA